MSRRLPVSTTSSGWQLVDDADAFYRGQAEIEAPASTRELSKVIRERIRQSLGDRVRELNVHVAQDEVVLSGNCATYYTKQLAQHAALGVLNHEQLENRIEVTVR